MVTEDLLRKKNDANMHVCACVRALRVFVSFSPWLVFDTLDLCTLVFLVYFGGAQTSQRKLSALVYRILGIYAKLC